MTGIWSVKTRQYALLVHGGAGDVPASHRDEQRQGCLAAATCAAEILEHGGSALDAVERAVELLENDPKYNAGTGACLTADGKLELDAAIMDGATLRAGAVCVLPAFANPIKIARAVLEANQHVLYAGEGAARFAANAGFRRANEADMITEAARERLASALRQRSMPEGGGTVGAVARDRAGNLASATSTGGIVAKAHGRVGDSPILGAGTYADNSAGAVSATGQGEGILRVILSARVVADLERGISAEAAARAGISLLEARGHASGGLIVISANGELAFARCTPTMALAAAWDGAPVVAGI